MKRLIRFLYDCNNMYIDELADFLVVLYLYRLMSKEPYLCFYYEIGME